VVGCGREAARGGIEVGLTASAGGADFFVEDCIKKKFATPPPNYSVDLSQGENCQTYSTGIVSECFAQCKAKSSSPTGGSK
jgi:hypothetical protein